MILLEAHLWYLELTQHIYTTGVFFGETPRNDHRCVNLWLPAFRPPAPYLRFGESSSLIMGWFDMGQKPYRLMRLRVPRRFIFGLVGRVV